MQSTAVRDGDGDRDRDASHGHGHAISKKNCWYQDARATFQGQARAQVKQLVAIAWSLISLFCFPHATHCVVPIDKEFIADYVTVRIKLLLVT